MKTVLALGNFDGVHTGHLSVLKEAKKQSEKYSCRCAALLFDCHPAEFFGRKISLITHDRERNELIKSQGVETETIKFSEVSDMSCEEFVGEILKNKYDCKAVCCGYNYHFGKNSSGNSETLRTECEKRGIEVFVCEKVEVENRPVSSSLIRELIQSGDIAPANRMLGRAFCVTGNVVCGEGNGKRMGFPTANQILPDDLVCPKNGVYVSTTEIQGRIYRSLTDIGVRPTFPGDNEKRIETYIFDYDGNLYKEEIKVSLLRYIRDEKKFPGEKELIKQLSEDMKIAKELF